MTPRPISVPPAISGMITFSNEHLAAKTLPNRKDEKNRFSSKTVLIDNREFQMVIIGDKNSRFSKIQEKAEKGLTVQTLLLDQGSAINPKNPGDFGFIFKIWDFGIGIHFQNLGFGIHFQNLRFGIFKFFNEIIRILRGVRL